VKGVSTDQAFLDVPTVESNAGVWPTKSGEVYDTLSPGAPPITVWKGFPRSHAVGLKLEFAPASP